MADTVGDTELAAVDIIVIIVYFAVVLFVGLWTSQSNRGSVGGYFLAGRNMNWLPLGASLFASNVGSLHFVGLAGSGAESGIGIAVFELNAIFVVLMLGWLFVPVYIASGVFTMPEYLKKRFGGDRIRMYLAVLSLILYIFTKISADLYAGALFIGQALQWNIYASIGVLLLIASIFTITGGLTAVMWTDFIQTIIMVIGAIGLMIIGFVEVGGMNGLRYQYERAVPNTTLMGNDSCGYPRYDYFNLIRDAKTGDIPWPGIVGLTINSIWYWCADQVIVQRALAGRTYSHAKGGTILCGYLKILPLFILVLPGMMSRVLYTDEIACVDPDICMNVCESPAGCSNIAYPLLVLNLLPAGLRGTMLAVMLSALMSSLTSIFNSSSTIFTMDIWIKIRKGASDIELMIVGRICVLVLMVVSILWIPIIQSSQGSQLFVYIQQVSSFLQPPVCAVYLLAIFWKRTNEPGAFWSLMIGLLVGGTRFLLEFVYPPPLCSDGVPDDRPWIVKDFHYLYFAVFLFLISAAIAVVVSLLTDPIDDIHLPRLTFWSRYSTEPRVDIDEEEEEQEEKRKDEQEKRNEDEEEDEENEKHEEHSKKKLSAEEYASLPYYRRAWNWICGIDQQLQDMPQPTEEELALMAAAQIDIYEKPYWQKFNAVQAIILMIFASFLWGFFAYSEFIVPLTYPD